MCTWSIITTSYSELKCCCSCAVQQNNRQCSINTLNRVGNSPVPTAVSTTSASHMPVLSTWKYCGTLFQLRIWFRILKLYQIKEVIQIETKPCRTLSGFFYYCWIKWESMNYLSVQRSICIFFSPKAAENRICWIWGCLLAIQQWRC